MKQQPPEMQKITVEVPRALLRSATRLTGQGTTGAVREALERLVARQAQAEFLKLRGTHQFPFTIKELRDMDE